MFSANSPTQWNGDFFGPYRGINTQSREFGVTCVKFSKLVMVSPMALGVGRVELPSERKRAPQRILAARSLDEFAYLLRGSRANLLAVAPFPFP